jgi:protein-disulfide isomerase
VTARPRLLVGGTLAGASFLAAALIVVSLLGSRGGAEPAPPAPAPEAVVEAPFHGIAQDGVALGSPDAPVTLVEYADLQCPYCARFAQATFPAIVDEYVRTGRVRVVFRGLAFIGPESDVALRAALAAGSQDRLWDVVHLLYGSQGAENGGWVTDGLLRAVGSTAGVDTARMLRELSSAAVERELAAARTAADAAGVRGTPSFEAGPTGGQLEPVTLTSLAPDELRARLDALLAG